MSNRFVWSIVAVLSLGGLIAFLSQSSAQRAGGGGAPGGMPGMAGMPQGMPGRFVVANASSSQVVTGTASLVSLSIITAMPVPQFGWQPQLNWPQSAS